MTKCEMIQPILAFALVSGLFAATAILMFHPMPDKGEQLISMLIGVLTKSFADVIGYYFGTTQGSKQKDQTIATMATGTGNSNTNQGA